MQVKYYFHKLIFCFIILFTLFLHTKLHASNYVNFTINKLNKSIVKIAFPTPMAIGKVVIPAINKSLWGKNICKFLIISSNNVQKICKISDKGKFTTNFNEVISQSLILSPIILDKTNKTNIDTHIQIQAKPVSIKRIETGLANFADSLISFHKENKCFSCHTLYPFATACRTASDRGISVPKLKLITIGHQISAMQDKNGYFTFPKAKTYGKISPTLCAGYIMAELTRYQPSLYLNIKSIVKITGELCDQGGNYLHDFNFPPFFIGQTTSDFFAAKLLSEYYYLSISFNKQPLEIALKTLENIKQKYSKLENLSGKQKLIALFGFPNMCSISPVNYINTIKSLSPVMMQKGIFNTTQFKTIFQVISEKLYTPPAYPFEADKNNIATKIWKTLGEIISIKVQDI